MICFQFTLVALSRDCAGSSMLLRASHWTLGSERPAWHAPRTEIFLANNGSSGLWCQFLISLPFFYRDRLVIIQSAHFPSPIGLLIHTRTSAHSGSLCDRSQGWGLCREGLTKSQPSAHTGNLCFSLSQRVTVYIPGPSRDRVVSCKLTDREV